MANTPEIQKRLAERELARRDKLFLATEILGMDFQADVHKELFDQFIPFDKSKSWREQSSIKDRLILWPRGHFKSSALVVEVIQAIINFPDIRVLLMRGTVGVSCNLLDEIRSHFTGIAPRSRFKEVFPEHCTDKKLGDRFKFTTPARVQKQLANATITVASPRSVKTGSHFDMGVFDDLIHDQNYKSVKQLAKVSTEFSAMIPLIDPGCFRYLVGTRYAFGDLYEQVIRNNTNGQWTISVKDCWTDDSRDVRFPQRTLADGRIIGFTREGLLQIQREDPGMFASQYLNKPATTGSQLFTEQKMLAAVVSEKDSPLLSQAFLFVDLASSQAETADDSVILAGKTDHLANMYVVDGIGGQWNPSQLAMQIIQMALKHRPLRIMIEKTASSTYFTDYLRVLCRDKGIVLPLDFIPVNNTKDAKNIRISSLEGHIRNRRLRFFAGLECWEKMLQQFIEFPRGRNGHDDYADTVALMAQVFGGQLAPVTPLSSTRHPLLEEMTRQEKQQELTQYLHTPQIVQDDSMGSDYE